MEKLCNQSQSHCEGRLVCVVSHQHLFVLPLSFVLLQPRLHPFLLLIELGLGIKFGLGDKHSPLERSLQ